MELVCGLETPRGTGVHAQHIVWCSSMPVAARYHTVVGGAGWTVAPLSLTNFGGASDPQAEFLAKVLMVSHV